MYHVIKTIEAGMLILPINSPSYQKNLDSISGQIESEIVTDTLPDTDLIDCWDISQNKLEINATKVMLHILVKKIEALKQATDAAFNPVFVTYSQAEMQSWPAQEAEAIAWLADNTVPTPTLDALKPRESKAEFCNIVVAKAEGFKEMLRIVGLSQRVRDDLKAMSLSDLQDAEPWLMLKAAISKAMK